MVFYFNSRDLVDSSHNDFIAKEALVNAMNLIVLKKTNHLFVFPKSLNASSTISGGQLLAVQETPVDLMDLGMDNIVQIKKELPTPMFSKTQGLIFLQVSLEMLNCRLI
jgi:hypothetical protein